MSSARAASAAPASVGRTPRDDRTRRRVPVSRSSFASCCDTAEGVYDSVRAAPEMEPARTTSRRTRSRVTSSM